jgi:hypothetical protein
VHDEHGDEAALWRDDNLRTGLAAPNLLDVGELALRELRGSYNDGDSGAVRLLVAAIAGAKGSQP